MVCLLDAPWVQLSVSAGDGWPRNALRHHWLMPISCHFRDCKALVVTSLTHVSGVITSVQTFTFTSQSIMVQCTQSIIGYRFKYTLLVIWKMHFCCCIVLDKICSMEWRSLRSWFYMNQCIFGAYMYQKRFSLFGPHWP